jgi:hypothetical protein
MAKTKISEFDTNPDNNTDINSINIAEGCAPSGINNAIRQLMSDLKEFQTGAASDPLTVGGVATFTAGTASAPAITTTGDTNTGIFFPAADTIAFSEGGTEAMRIDSSGNVGIGVTPSAWTLTGAKAVQVGPYGSLSSNNSGGKVTDLGHNIYGGYSYLATGQASFYRQFDGQHQWFNAPSGTAGNAITFTQAMTLNASGNLGIGATSPAQPLDISVTAAGAYINSTGQGTSSLFLAGNSGSASLTQFGGELRFNTGGTANTAGTGVTERMRLDTGSTLTLSIPTASSTFFGYKIKAGTDVLGAFQMDTNNGQLNLTAGYSGWGGFFTFTTNGSERMRIDSSGNLLVGTGGSNPSASVAGSRIGPSGFMEISRGSGTNSWSQMSFINGNGTVGTINTSGTSTSYVTSSDYRLKENIAPMTGALAKVQQLKPVTYNWKVDGSSGQGFIAHELAEVVPECVTGEKDAVETYIDEDGLEQTRPKYQGIDTSFLVATLTAAIQELKAEVDSLKAQLENK